MSTEPFDAIPLWVFFILAMTLSLSALEGGYRLGRWRHVGAAGERDASVGTMVAAILGLLAFMLAFTFSLAATRFDARRMTLLDEANAIGTTYLRARLLPDSERGEIEKLLREYVDVRVRAVDEQNVVQAIAVSEELHERLWNQAVSAGAKNPNSVMTGIFIQSLNELIDLHAKRVMIGARSRVPTIIWIGLFTLSIIGMASVGYQAGLSATRRSPAMFLLVLAFAGILYLNVDLDRPFEGMLRAGQLPMKDLQRSMQPDQR